MTMDATFWVTVSFLIFLGILVYFKIPQKVKEILEQNITNIKSQIKRNRQNEKRRARNKAIRSEVNSRVKSTLKSAESGQSDEEALRIAIKKIDKAARKNILHKNTAARKKSRLTKRYNELTN